MQDELERLQSIERCAARLWPAVRFFGLCGANPEYIAAVIELGELLGNIKPGESGGSPIGADVLVNAAAKAKREAVQQVADAIACNPEIRGRIGRGACEEISQIVKSMKV